MAFTGESVCMTLSMTWGSQVVVFLGMEGRRLYMPLSNRITSGWVPAGLLFTVIMAESALRAVFIAL